MHEGQMAVAGVIGWHGAGVQDGGQEFARSGERGS